MDQELLDYSIPFSGKSKAGRRLADRSDRTRALATTGELPLTERHADSGDRDGAGDEDRALQALARTLSQDARQACAERAAMRAFPRVIDDSDPCVCGEALLLMMAAEARPGRAPVSAFEEFGGPR